MLLLIAICLPIFLMATAFAINVAYMHLARAELRIATDAAARAGARTLSLTQSKEAALTAAEEAAARNRVASEPLLLEPADVEFGMNTRLDDASPWIFTPETLGAVNAVKNNRIHMLPGDYTCIPGPRFIQTLDDLAEIIRQNNLEAE